MLKTFKAAETRVRAGRPEVIITTAGLDSERDRCQIDRLRWRVPLRVMVAHEWRDLPVAQVDRRDQIRRVGDTIVAEFRWLEGDARADRVKNAFTQNMLSASIGVVDVDSEANAYGGRDFWGEVVEFSLTAIPANADCQAVLRDLFASAPHARSWRNEDDLVIDLGALRRDLDEEREEERDAMRRGIRRGMARAARYDENAMIEFAPAELAAAIKAWLPDMVLEAVDKAIRMKQGRLD